MTNRKKLLKTNEYDTLVRMNENMSIAGGRICIVDVLYGGPDDSPKRANYIINRCKTYCDCEKCIAAWLNEEAE